MEMYELNNQVADPSTTTNILLAELCNQTEQILDPPIFEHMPAQNTNMVNIFESTTPQYVRPICVVNISEGIDNIAPPDPTRTPTDQVVQDPKTYPAQGQDREDINSPALPKTFQDTSSPPVVDPRILDQFQQLSALWEQAIAEKQDF